MPMCRWLNRTGHKKCPPGEKEVKPQGGVKGGLAEKSAVAALYYNKTALPGKSYRGGGNFSYAGPAV